MHLATRALLALFCCAGLTEVQAATNVPLGGNAFVTTAAASATETINDTGLHDWTSAQTIVSTYFHVAQPGSLQLSLAGYLAGSTHSQIKVTVGGASNIVDMYSGGSTPVPAGSFYIDAPGYVRVDLQGISKDGGYFGDISDLQIDGTAAVGAVFANDPANFYWSRRGPSVHLGYDVPADTKYFYSEITVPTGEDKIGSYFMANGFSTGYFGFQVKDATKRWVLFSVWNSSLGPTTLVRKGPGVTAQTFSGEGSGGQSYLVYAWKAGTTYRFLTRAESDGQGNTLYTSWFGVPNARSSVDWKLIATWKYLGGTTYLGGMYSFLENFIDRNGYLGRQASYGNQWAVSSSGVWTEITRAHFTVDATGENQQRLDFAGGVSGNAFFLHNGGFFNDTVAPYQYFTRPPMLIHPDVNFGRLP